MTDTDYLLLILGIACVIAGFHFRFSEEYETTILPLPEREQVKVIWPEPGPSSPGIWRAWKDCEGECID